MPRRDFDIVISGAGPAGLAMAIAAKWALGDSSRILVCDPLLGRAPSSIRSYAISSAPRRMLEKLAVWHRLEGVQPIVRMDITDSRLHDAIRQSYLNLENSGADEPLAHLIFHDDLMRALNARSAELGIEFRTQGIASYSASPASAALTLNDRTRLNCGLLVACDGARSPLRELARIPVSGWSYERDAIVATLAIERPHNGLAIQHFLPAGTFALLPATGNRVSIVWVEKPGDARSFCALPADEFTAEVQMRAGHEFGQLTLLTRPERFPLALQRARRFHAPRLALVADAAHTMHPLAGQGLNLGLRDIAFLIESLSKDLALGLDIAGENSLARYDRSRQAETTKMLATTDMLFRLFTNDLPPLRLARDVGLGLVNRLSLLKDGLIGQAAGDKSETPALLRAS